MNIEQAIHSVYDLFQNGNLEKAEDICRQILNIQPDNAEALHFLGIIHYQLGNYDSAIRHIKKSLQFDPTEAYAYFNLGNVYRDKQQFDEAIQNYQKALQIYPDLADAYYNLGIVYRGKGKLDEAIQCFKKALQINPNDADAYNNLGIALQDIGELDGAVIFLKKALQANPYSVNAYYNLGTAYQQKKELDDAVACYQKVTQLDPSNSAAYYRLGSISLERNHLDDAIALYRKAIQLNPEFSNAYHDLGIAFQEKNQIADSVACFRKILQLNQEDAESHWNLSLALLLSGDFKEGWKEFEWRLKVKDFPPRSFSKPLWDGSDISGKTILLHEEQGFGDTIQFIRYAPLIAQSGARILVECQKELKSLLENVEGISRVIIQGEKLPDFDMHCHLMSLPLLFHATLENIPARVPYISVNSDLVKKWRNEVQQNISQLKIGIVWASETRFTAHIPRSCSLDVFSSLAMLGDITFYSLQKGKAAMQAKNPPVGMRIFDYTEEIHDFSDTAALIENLDLVISVDTAVAHLAGALGKPVWTLLPFVPAWRWMLDRTDSPWYPSMRLFRQPAPGDWKSVIDQIAESLQKIVISEKL